MLSGLHFWGPWPQNVAVPPTLAEKNLGDDMKKSPRTGFHSGEYDFQIKNLETGYLKIEPFEVKEKLILFYLKCFVARQY